MQYTLQVIIKSIKGISLSTSQTFCLTLIVRKVRIPARSKLKKIMMVPDINDPRYVLT